MFSVAFLEIYRNTPPLLSTFYKALNIILRNRESHVRKTTFQLQNKVYSLSYTSRCRTILNYYTRTLPLQLGHEMSQTNSNITNIMRNTILYIYISHIVINDVLRLINLSTNNTLGYREEEGKGERLK